MKKTSAKHKRPEAAALAPADGESLLLYRKKRDPAQTNEPFTAERNRSGGPTRAGRFVVHLHDASRTHYDLRLQFGGTLKSFAVPKGPSLDPDQKHLAVNTEDHPLEYLDFEAVIPDGNYGAGPMIAWDLGRVRYLDGSAEEGLARGKIDFELQGFKLCGRFALVHTGKRKAAPGAAKPEWLLLKKGDRYSSKERDILVEQPESVLSGLRIEELARKTEISRELVASAAELGAPISELDVTGLTPMLCSMTGAKLDDAKRLYELKLDGVRIIADKKGDAAALRYRNGRAASFSYPEITRAVRSLAPERLVLDGEIVAFDENGRPNFQRLASRIHALRPFDVLRAQAQISVVYVVFDILALEDRALFELPLFERKALLSRVIKGRGLIRALDHIPGQGEVLLDFCKAQGLEGIVAKRAASPYRPGPRRSDDWVKIKCEREDEFVVVGWITGKGARHSMGAVDLASYAGDKLRVRGKAGSGLDEKAIEELLTKLAALEISEPPAEGELTREVGVRHYTRPEVVVRIQHMGWTDDARLRFPIFRGLRQDVDPKSCDAAPEDELIETLTAATSNAPTSSSESALEATSQRPSSRVVITNRDKLFWPDQGYTKADLCEYYAAVAPVLLPFLRGRPVVLVRYPDGISGKNFYQWRAPEGTPAWIRTLELRDEEDRQAGESKSVFLIDDVDGLVHIANLGAIPIHVLASSEGRLDCCDFLTVDLDIGEQPFKSAVILALSLRELLQEIGLLGFPKTSGQKGLHVLIPLAPGVSFDTAKLLVELLGRLLTARHPEMSTMERRVSKRGPRVYVDTGQTGRSRTIVAPYSVRAHPQATVSTPLAWEELHIGLDPSRFTLLTVPARLAEIGDPMSCIFELRPDVGSAVARLESMAK